ncbi:Transcription factor tau subunit sfc3 [Coniochaeta hoffmannii]|uniref:Transcription factor tau subunit sfc3 n=1 Tax=Coniochaeta hoffmannii TaxID=91930 RepID=A0AA38S4G4_9PEZI|nr:Transcription factor tau subunit sfc3 [Coniochaeta hoffmannii]
MKEGLEGVVEFLLPELAFAGEQGLSVDGFLALTKQYFRRDEKASLPPQQGSQNNGSSVVAQASQSATTSTALDDAELTFARGAPAQGDTPAPGRTSSQAPTRGQKERAKKPKLTLTTRPRIQVTEETVWQAITGHGVDYKQIPRLEWHLLQGIAPTKHEGILQGDLRRLVGQDKRSVPKRTDFLATKGYIVKRTIMVRASKTSKLWLAGFAPSIAAEGGETSQAKDVKMTKEILTRDLSPVPWHAKWTGADIDVETFAESILAIVKAWGVMRYSDIRLKMGIEELRWQMRTMARLTRNLVDMGIIKYTAATFANSRKVWKDCIKFIRDPTEAEWTRILATGKKTSKYTDLSKDRQPKPFALSLADKAASQPQETTKKSSGDGWVPEKPLQQTLFDAVAAAGPEGATNPQISAGTVGYNFRRYCGTMLTNMSMCKQPPHLEKFQLHRKLVRVDKTSAFIYTTNQFAQPAGDQEHPDQSVPVPSADETPTAETPAQPKTAVYGFRPVQGEELADPSTSLSEISRKLLGRHRQHAPPKRPFADDAAGPTEDGTSTKRRRVGGAHDGPLPDGPIEKLPGKPPGAYIAEPGSLNPSPKRTGRPKRSLVVIFKSDKLKDPAFWENGWAATRNSDETVVSVQYNGIPGKLCLNRKDKTVVFSRKPQPPGKEPLTIHLDDLREEPVVRPVPGCDDNSLVFVTRETNQNPSWNFVFLFKDDAGSQERVAEILKRVKSIANAEPIEDEPPAQTPKSQVTSTAAPGSAGVPCNPDFVAKPTVPMPSKRRRPPTLPPGFGERADDEAAEESVNGRRKTRQRGILLTQIC